MTIYRNDTISLTSRNYPRKLFSFFSWLTIAFCQKNFVPKIYFILVIVLSFEKFYKFFVHFKSSTSNLFKSRRLYTLSLYHILLQHWTNPWYESWRLFWLCNLIFLIESVYDYVVIYISIEICRRICICSNRNPYSNLMPKVLKEFQGP